MSQLGMGKVSVLFTRRLERNTLSLANGVALASAAMAPVLSVVLNAPAAGPAAGASLPSKMTGPSPARWRSTR